MKTTHFKCIKKSLDFAFLTEGKIYKSTFCKEHPRYYCFICDDGTHCVNPFMFPEGYRGVTLKRVPLGYNTKLGKILYT